ncbi:MAG TPA: TIR domain-containing protein, partial [Pseudonocardiaceae bacterium]
MAVVFVNYRVQEHPGYAALLHRELADRFGADAVFLAAQSIRPGDDYVREIFANLRDCEIVLAVMGDRWVATLDKDEFDWVHHELATAFANGARVVPVLVEDADLPTEAELPADIAALAHCQYVKLRHYSVDADLAQIVGHLTALTPVLADRRTGDAVADGQPNVFRPADTPNCRIAVIPGDIRRVRSIDVWVNSENTDLRMARVTEFSTSAVIRYWGAERDESGRVRKDVIAAELAARAGPHRPVAPGTVVVTGAGALRETNNVRHILHVAVVQGEPGAGFRQVRDIGWCVTNTLVQATALARDDTGVRSVLFPLLGTGMAGAALQPTARTMLRAILDYLVQEPDTPLRLIAILAYTERERSVLRHVLRELRV